MASEISALFDLSMQTPCTDATTSTLLYSLHICKRLGIEDAQMWAGTCIFRQENALIVDEQGLITWLGMFSADIDWEVICAAQSRRCTARPH